MRASSGPDREEHAEDRQDRSYRRETVRTDEGDVEEPLRYVDEHEDDAGEHHYPADPVVPLLLVVHDR